MMYFSGFADEAGADLVVQIQATQELGWTHIEMRNVKVGGGTDVDFPEGARAAVHGGNIHDIPDAAFERVVQATEEAGIRVNCFGSALGNGAKTIETPFETEWQEARRAVSRMQRLGTKLIRVMSYPSVQGSDSAHEAEGLRRLNEMQKLFADAGLQMVHENCAGFGGRSASHSLRLIESVPGLKLVFDTGNPTREADHSKPVDANGTYPKQSAWGFYRAVKPFIAHVHIKDGVYDPRTGQHQWVMPGEGQGDVRRIVADLLQTGYDGGLSIEPHLPASRPDQPYLEPQQARYLNYVDYGRRLMQMVNEVQAE